MKKRFVTESIRKAIYARDNMVCCYCGKTCILATCKGMTLPEQHAYMRLHKNDFATLDHIVSQWEIAQTCESDAEFRRKIADPINLVTVCNACNSSKKNTPLYVWVEKKGYNYRSILRRIAKQTQKGI